jgi:tetratricopeptide (TPR) repeat protein
MENRPKPASQAGPFVSILIALILCGAAATGLFVIAMYFKREIDAHSKQRNYRDKLTFYLEDTEARLRYAHEVMASGREEGYANGLLRAQDNLDTLEEMITKYPGFAAPRRLRGRIYTILRDFDQAYSEFTAYIDIKPEAFQMAYLDRAYVLALRYMQRAMAGASPTELEPIADKGKADLELYHAWMIEELKRPDADQTTGWEFYIYRGCVELFNRRLFEAQTMFETHQDDREETHLPSYALAATAAILNSDYEGVEKRLAYGLKLCPKHPEILMAMGWLKMELDKPAEALASFDAALKADNAFVLAYYGIARARLAQGEFDGALDALKIMNNAAGAKPIVTYGTQLLRARALSKRHAASRAAADLDEAVKAFNEAISLYPSSIEAHLERAILQIEGGKLEEAERDLTFILSTHGDAVDARLARADLYIRKKDRSKAAADLDAAARAAEEKKLDRAARIAELRKQIDALPQ